MNCLTISVPDLSSIQEGVVNFTGLELNKEVYDEIYKEFNKIKKKSRNILALQINEKVISLINRFKGTRLLHDTKRTLLLEEKPCRYFKMEKAFQRTNHSAEDYIQNSLNEYDMFKFFYALVEDSSIELTIEDEELLEFEVNKKQDLQVHLQLFINKMRINSPTEFIINVKFNIKKALNLLSKENPMMYLLLKEKGLLCELEETVHNIKTNIKIELIGGI